MIKQINDRIDAHRQTMLDFSHYIHANPELGFKEYKAAKALSQVIDDLTAKCGSLGPQLKKQVGGKLD